jgi:hypothetical protein
MSEGVFRLIRSNRSRLQTGTSISGRNARAQAGRHLRAAPDREVVIARREVDGLGRCRQADIDRGVFAQEARQARNQPAHGEGRRCVHGEHGRFALTGERSSSERDPRQGRFDLREQHAAFVGQQDAAVEAPEQRRAEPVLQNCDLPAHGAMRDVEFFRRAFETGMARGGLECANSVERWEASQVIEPLEHDPEKLQTFPKSMSSGLTRGIMRQIKMLGRHRDSIQC